MLPAAPRSPKPAAVALMVRAAPTTPMPATASHPREVSALMPDSVSTRYDERAPRQTALVDGGTDGALPVDGRPEQCRAVFGHAAPRTSEARRRGYRA